MNHLNMPLDTFCKNDRSFSITQLSFFLPNKTILLPFPPTQFSAYYFFFWFKNLLLLPPPTVKLFNFFYDISHSFKKVLFLDYVNGWKICHRLNSNNSFLETFVCLKHDCESFSPQHFWSQGQTVVLKWPIITIAAQWSIQSQKCAFLNGIW